MVLPFKRLKTNQNFSRLGGNLPYMKKIFFSICALAIISFTVTSCAAGKSMKRDCQGGRHVKLKNGVWI